jgi:3-(3-hydroxy-phenyl)propionate hydroxylase
MKESHAVVIVGGGPTGLMLAGELALARVDVAIVERRESQELAGTRAGGLHARTIEVLDQRGIADRFLSRGQVTQTAHFAGPLDLSVVPTRHNYGLGSGRARTAACAMRLPRGSDRPCDEASHAWVAPMAHCQWS